MKEEKDPKDDSPEMSSDEKLTRRQALKRIAIGLGVASVGLLLKGCLPGRLDGGGYRDSYSSYGYSSYGYSSYGYSSQYYSSIHYYDSNRSNNWDYYASHNYR